MNGSSRIVAVLGPTNTGKTHYAIERMLGHRTGVIGLPLRLLAREVYDKIVAVRGPSVVALVTGEERIVPPRAQYWVCTVEAMPEGMGADFVAIDEIQLCADPERGHVFTQRLLSARGSVETLFMGSETMRGAIAAMEPKFQPITANAPRRYLIACSGFCATAYCATDIKMTANSKLQKRFIFSSGSLFGIPQENRPESLANWRPRSPENVAMSLAPQNP